MKTEVTKVRYNHRGEEIEDTVSYEMTHEEVVSHFRTLGFQTSNINSLFTVMVHEDFPTVQDYIRIRK